MGGSNFERTRASVQGREREVAARFNLGDSSRWHAKASCKFALGESVRAPEPRDVAADMARDRRDRTPALRAPCAGRMARRHVLGA